MVDQLSRRLAAFAAGLDDLCLPWAVVGGMAVSVRAEPRFTRDIDIALAVSGDAAAEDVVRELRSRGYDDFQHFEHATGRLATVRFRPRDNSRIVVDVLFASSGIEPEVVAGATIETVFKNVRAPIASVEHLIALKTLSLSEARPLDRSDLKELLERASQDQLDAADAALELINARGFSRGKDLHAELDGVVKLYAPALSRDRLTL